MKDKRKYTIHLIGHGHIDPTWLWRWTEGYEEVRATFRSALARMDETPGFVFTSSSACFYAWVKACDPEMFEQIKKRVAEGRWDVAGGWWVEPDCNVPGGEAFVRHGLYSQRFFEREFGCKARVGFNPDSFGHAGTLPQIYKKMGIDYYVYMRPAPVYEMDYPDGTTFWWKAKDGTQILACALPESYVAGPKELEARIQRLPNDPHLNKDQTHIIGFYGVGNHGGGPTKEAITAILRAQKAKNMPTVLFSTLEDYFKGFQGSMKASDIPIIDTDLQHHARGCYSVHSETKRLNRACEHALMSAERLAAIAWRVQGRPVPMERLEQAWQLVLYNQFHDILAGTSIESSYEDTRDQYGAARNTAAEIANESLQALAGDIDTTPEGNTVVVYNPLPWPVKRTVKAGDIVGRMLDRPLQFVDDKEKPVPSQPVDGERIGHIDYAFTAEVPALGYRCYHARSGAKAGSGSKSTHNSVLESRVRASQAKGKRNEPQLDADRHSLENQWWRIVFDPYSGEMCRLYDKKARTEVLRKGNVLACMVDQSDTWSHGYDEWRVEAGRFEAQSIELLELGEVRATIRVVQRFKSSKVEQFITIYRYEDAIDCRFRINWQEQYTMLKLAYETTVEEGEAWYDAPYGCEKRNTEGFEEPGQQWFDLTGLAGRKKCGLAVLNDSKYGFDVRDGVMRVTLLRSPAYAHHDRGRYNASEPWPIMDQGWHTVRIRLVPHSDDWRAADVPRKAWELNEPPVVHIESAHPGSLPAKASFLEATSANVLLTVLKKSEDGEMLIVRGYETAGKKTKTTIKMDHLGVRVETTFGPHEIKTLRIDPENGKATEVNLLEEPSA